MILFWEVIWNIISFYYYRSMYIKTWCSRHTQRCYKILSMYIKTWCSRHTQRCYKILIRLGLSYYIFLFVIFLKIKATAALKTKQLYEIWWIFSAQNWFCVNMLMKVLRRCASFKIIRISFNRQSNDQPNWLHFLQTKILIWCVC